MDEKQFSKKLADLMSLAVQNNRSLNRAQITGVFEEGQLGDRQLELIYQYLNSQNIVLEDIELEQAEEENALAEPLSAEEEEYILEYRESISEMPEKDKEFLWNQYSGGDVSQAGKIAEAYFSYIVELCCQNHKSTYDIGDMIQDMNLQMILLLNGGSIHSEEELLAELQKSVEYLLNEHEEGAFRDNYLVKRVQKLDDALREITEDDEESNFSVEELSVFLDMSVDEIKDVLKLTGDENEN